MRARACVCVCVCVSSHAFEFDQPDPTYIRTANEPVQYVTFSSIFTFMSNSISTLHDLSLFIYSSLTTFYITKVASRRIKLETLQDARGNDGKTNFIFRVKEQALRVTLQSP